MHVRQDCFHDGAYDVSATTTSGGSGSGSGRTPSLLGPAVSAEQLAAAGLLGVWPLPGGFVRPGPVLNWAHVQRKMGRLGLTPPCTDSRCAYAGCVLVWCVGGGGGSSFQNPKQPTANGPGGEGRQGMGRGRGRGGRVRRWE